MSSREERINKLALTLKASGLAKSDAQARIMAEEMVGVEENVQKKYEEEHSRVHEYLKTAKNLGSLPLDKKKENVEKKFNDTTAFKDKDKSVHSNITENSSYLSSKNNIIISSDSKSSSYETVDESAHKKVFLEPVHTDIPIAGKNLRDMMLNQIKEDNHEIKTPEQLSENVNSKGLASDFKGLSKESVDFKKNDYGLDSEKLKRLMEEDGPLEDRTREIKGKPSVIKPKEEYEENSVDLSEMFNVNKK